jgi:hypothetical protein
MTIKEITVELEKSPSQGLELTKRKGILTSTWCIYKRENHFYFFDICEDFIFDENHKYTLEELMEEFENGYFEIDCAIE